MRYLFHIGDVNQIITSDLVHIVMQCSNEKIVAWILLGTAVGSEPRSKGRSP